MIDVTLFNNVKWVACSQIVKILSQLIGMVVFSRFLTPVDFGIMSMALVVVNFANIIRDLGASSAIIQKKNISQELISSVFFMNVIFGILLFLCVFLASPYIAYFFKENKLVSVLILIALSFPVNSVTSIHLSLLERESKFNTIAKIEILSSLSALIVAIFISYYGGGVYSLVCQTLVYSILSAIGFSLSSRWLPSLFFSLKEIQSIFSFTSNLISFNFVNYFSRNSDQIIIGRTFSPAILGQYSLAYRIMLFPIQNITFVLTRSLYPLLSRSQDEKKESLSLYLHVIKTIILIIPPLMLGLSSLSKEFVLLVFGEKWIPISQLITVLAPIAILQSLVSTTGAVFMSQGKTNLLFRISIFNAILQIGSFIVGSFYNIDILIKLYLIANIIIFVPNMLLAIRILGGRWKDLLLIIYKPLIASIIMYFVILFCKSIVYLEIPTLTFRLVCYIFWGLFIYVSCLCILERKSIFSILRELTKK
ncbi:MOP flippase family protein [Pluralibacter gergoviae]|uniref:MOP flippase family protein n=1 Tax=Pluralibacter gergoviae TaxID=61647 RepID=UPI0021F45DF3|nr:MOP flippase family protein [Pluralibacter gergoviae]MCV7759082.1 MOP flippase family protein [Pluralibacter gergoviae]